VKLDQIAKSAEKFVIRAVDGTALDGLQVTYRADRSSWDTGIKKIPDLKAFHAIEIAAGEQTARIDANYNVRLSGVSLDSHTILNHLKSLFEQMRSFHTLAIQRT
jgi:hypothetical protein